MPVSISKVYFSGFYSHPSGVIEFERKNNMSPKLFSRRNFIKTSSFAVLAVPLLGIPRRLWAAKVGSKSVPLPAGATAVSESDPVAAAIGYKSDIKDIDYVKYPQRKKPAAKDQFCKSCALFTPVNESWGKCQLLASGLVNSQGWCGSWSKKA